MQRVCILKQRLKLNMLAFFTLKYDVSMIHCITDIGFSGFSKAQHPFALLKEVKEINGTNKA